MIGESALWLSVSALLCSLQVFQDSIVELRFAIELSQFIPIACFQETGILYKLLDISWSFA